MSKLFNDVDPGGLITANWWNQVLHTINSFDDRISALEKGASASGQPIINPLPPGPWHVGDSLTVTGQNLGPVQSTIVTIGTATVTQFNPGSGNTALSFTIPTLFVAQTGTALLLTVQTPTGSATTSIIVYPAQATVPNGTLSLSPPTQAPAGNLAAGVFTFTFVFTANLNMTETFTVSPSVDVGWAAVYVDGAGNAITPSQLIIQPVSSSQPVSVSVPIKVTIPASPAPVGQLTLAITSVHNPSVLLKTAGPFALTIGSAGPLSNPNIQPSIGYSGPNANYDGTSVIVPAGTPVFVPFSCLFVNAGNYNVKVIQPSSNPGNLWTISLFVPTPNAQTGVGTITTTLPNTNLTNGIVVQVNSAAGAVNNSFTLHVESAANATIATELPVPIKL